MKSMMRPRLRHNLISRPFICTVYADQSMLGSAILCLGSLKRLNPGVQCLLYTSYQLPFQLQGLEVFSIDEALQKTLGVNPMEWGNLYPGIIGHYFRKTAMWIDTIDRAVDRGITRVGFCDADVFFLGSLLPIQYMLERCPLAAYCEPWTPMLDEVYENQSEEIRSLLIQRFGTDERFRGGYHNAGVVFAHANSAVRDCFHDVLDCTKSFPALAQQICFPEQTLLNFSLANRGIKVCDLGSLCPPGYQQSQEQMGMPTVVHFMSDQYSRRPSVLVTRFPEQVEQSLGAMLLSKDILCDAGIWN